jgi:hypothetical protein
MGIIVSNKLQAYWKHIVLLGLLSIIIYQAKINWRDYVQPWLKDNKGYILVSSAQRTGILIMDRERARFIRYLDAYLPENAAIVIPPPGGSFSSQSIMQNFLFPRAVLACCGSDDALCQKCLNNPNYYILAVDSFPLPEEQPGRVLIPYPQATNRLRGVYVPQEMSDQLSLPDPLVYGKTTPIKIQALVIDICIIFLLFTLGGVFVALLLEKPTWGDLFELNIPLSMGILSWSLFLFSYFGIPLTLTLVIFLICVMFVFVIFLYRFKYGVYPKLPALATGKLPSRWQEVNGIFALLFALVIAIFGVMTFLSIGRGYSTYDDIVNWSFKGYAMVDSGTIWAAGRWGGHVLAYPMNLALSIGIFRLADGDTLPGSKFLYVLLTISLLFGSYRFLLRNQVDRIWAIAGILALLLVPIFFMHATIGLANLPFTSYLILGILYSLEGVRRVKIHSTLLGGVLLALAAWTRPEGLLFGIAFLGLIYLLAVFVMKSKIPIKLVLYSLLPMLIIPGSWMFLLGRSGMGDDQIGLALKALIKSNLSGEFNFESIGVLSKYAFMAFNNIYHVFLLFAVLVIIISIPVTKWYLDKFRLSLALLDLLAFLLPVFMFFVASFNEANFVVFLDQSFTRAFLPALTLTMLVALLAASNRPSSNNCFPEIERNGK